MDNFRDLHYNSISSYLKEKYGQRIVKLSLDAGLTCPNRDGTKAYGGCTFCLGGSGEFTASIDEQIAAARAKWNEPVKFIAYFQSYTNTYGDPEYLRMLWNEALTHEDVIGISIATRPDCIDGMVLDALAELNEKCMLWIELGFQTANEKTAEDFNRCYENEVFKNTMIILNAMHIKTVVHLMLGFKGEDKEQFIKSAEYVAKFKPFGIKLHMLHLMRNTVMGEEYLNNPWPLLTKDEYVDSIVSILERIPRDITIHRLTGDAPKEDLIAPYWTANKHDVLNAIQHEFSVRDTYQGKLLE
ncbi:MAG: TIGR01212 family radical SAM protein [Bacillota bacterium]|nr:TIGR01212 family radical SAM protein [Bacillota bacterium]